MRERLSLLANVIPRSVASSVRASKRSGSAANPPFRLGPRQVCETTLDEFFVAASALVRAVPDPAAVEAAVAKCGRATEELVALGVAGCNPAPGNLQTVKVTPRRLGTTQFERLDYVSAPDLPPSLRAAGLAGWEVASVRTMRHLDGPRPWVVWVHGAGQGRSDDLISLRARHIHEDLGLNVALPVLPMHGLRRRKGQLFPSFDPLVNIATTLRAVYEVRSVIEWVTHQQPESIAMVGLSLGAPIAALASQLEPAIDAVGVVVPMLDLHGTLAHHLERGGASGRRLAALLRSDVVRRASSVVDPMVLQPRATPRRRVVLAASNDRVTSVRAAQQLQERWRCDVHWHEGGHIGHLMSSDARSFIDGFLSNELGVRS